MSKPRYKFGPQFVGTWPRPSVAGELPDPDVGASIDPAVRPSAPGTIEMDVIFHIPAYDASRMNELVEVHAISFPPGHGIPIDPEVALAAGQPMATARTSGITGTDVRVTIVGGPDGQQTVVTVLGFQDPTPAAPPDPAPAS